MADHSMNALMAAARAMEEVVLPAVDKGHPLAMEQAALVAKFLKLFGQRWAHANDRNRFELHHYAQLAAALQTDAAEVSPSIAAALQAANTAAEHTLQKPGVGAMELQSAAQAVAGVLTALVRTAQLLGHPASGRIEQRVLEASAELLGMQRAWFLPQGWEPDPAAIRPLNEWFATLDRQGG
jgi:hypothetical protein